MGNKGGRCLGLTILPPSCANCLEILEPQSPGTHRACPALYMDYFTFTVYIKDPIDRVISSDTCTSVSLFMLEADHPLFYV